jgi:hypothetical protein
MIAPSKNALVLRIEILISCDIISTSNLLDNMYMEEDGSAHLLCIARGMQQPHAGVGYTVICSASTNACLDVDVGAVA